MIDNLTRKMFKEMDKIVMETYAKLGTTAQVTKTVKKDINGNILITFMCKDTPFLIVSGIDVSNGEIKIKYVEDVETWKKINL